METLREDILEAFTEEQVEEIERRLDTGDFFEFLTDLLDEWSGDDADELLELIDTQLGDVGVDLKFEKRGGCPRRRRRRTSRRPTSRTKSSTKTRTRTKRTRKKKRKRKTKRTTRLIGRPLSAARVAGRRSGRFSAGGPLDVLVALLRRRARAWSRQAAALLDARTGRSGCRGTSRRASPAGRRPRRRRRPRATAPPRARARGRASVECANST